MGDETQELLLQAILEELQKLNEKLEAVTFKSGRCTFVRVYDEGE